MKNLVSYINTYGVESSDNNNGSIFNIVPNSKVWIHPDELKLLKKCCLRVVKYQNEDKETSVTKLLLTAKINGESKPRNVWAKLDGPSYKKYKDNVNADIDPSKICLYELEDPSHQYGVKERKYRWLAVRILDDAVVESSISDDEDFKRPEPKPVRRSTKVRKDEVPF